MKASPSDQRSILDIQRLDQQATSLRHKAAILPELAELASTRLRRTMLAIYALQQKQN